MKVLTKDAEIKLIDETHQEIINEIHILKISENLFQKLTPYSMNTADVTHVMLRIITEAINDLRELIMTSIEEDNCND